MLLFPRYPLADGLSISRVITGLWPMADRQRRSTEFDAGQAAMAMSPYVEAGLTTFDMADQFGASEDVAGIFGERAERLTQWTPKPGSISPDDAGDAVLRAMRRLRTDRIDLLQFHTSSFADPSWLDALFQLQELKREGLIHHLGVSNFDTAHLRIALKSGIDLVSNQVSFNLIDTRAEGPMLDFCVAHNIRLLAHGVLLGGFLSDNWVGRNEPEWELLGAAPLIKYGRFIRAATNWAGFQKLLRALDEVATKHRTSIATVAARLTLDHEAVAAVLIGSDLAGPSHIDEAVRVFALTLDDDDRKLVAKATKGFRPIAGDCGDEYRRAPFLIGPGDSPHASSAMTLPYTVKPGPRGRTLVLSGTESERTSGHARAHRLDDRIWVSGTTALHGDRPIGGNDPRAQFDFIIDKIEGSLIALGATLDDIVRTRVFVRHDYDLADIARAHGSRFQHILPASSFVQATLGDEAALVEVEAEAVVTG